MTEIIGIAVKGASKTQIMYKANLSFCQLKRYLTLLLNQSLLKKSEFAGRDIYKATPKGIKFMQRQQQIIDLISDKPPRNCVKPFTFNRKVNAWLISSNRYKCAYSKTHLNANQRFDQAAKV